MGEAELVIKSYDVSEKDKVIINGSFGENEIIIRVPLNVAATSSESRNAELLKHIESSKTGANWCPVVLGEGKVDGLQYYVEGKLRGCPLSVALRGGERTSMLDSIARLLETLNGYEENPEVRSLSGDFYSRYIGTRLERLFGVVKDTMVRKQLEGAFHDRLYGLDVRVGVTHGDFSVNNILVEGSNFTGLIDWEAGSIEGIPVLDAINYLGSVHRLFNQGFGVPRLVPLMASGNWPVADEWAFLMERYAQCGIEPSHHESFVYLNWLRNVTFRLKFRLPYDPPGIESYVRQVLKTVLQSGNS